MTDTRDIVEKLYDIETATKGSPFPRCLAELGGDEFDWADALSRLVGEARKEIIELRRRLEL